MFLTHLFIFNSCVKNRSFWYFGTDHDIYGEILKIERVHKLFSTTVHCTHTNVFVDSTHTHTNTHRFPRS